MIAGLVNVIQSIVPAMIRSTTGSGSACGIGVVINGDLVDFGHVARAHP